MDYCIKKVGMKAIIAPEEFRTQKFYEMLKTLSENAEDNPLRLIIIKSDKNLRYERPFLVYSNPLNISSTQRCNSLQ